MFHRPSSSGSRRFISREGGWDEGGDGLAAFGRLVTEAIVCAGRGPGVGDVCVDGIAAPCTTVVLSTDAGAGSVVGTFSCVAAGLGSSGTVVLMAGAVRRVVSLLRRSTPLTARPVRAAPKTAA